MGPLVFGGDTGGVNLRRTVGLKLTQNIASICLYRLIIKEVMLNCLLSLWSASGLLSHTSYLTKVSASPVLVSFVYGRKR